MSAEEPTRQELLRENEELRVRLAEAEDTLEAIRSGAVDAVMVSGEEGEQLYTLQAADYTYRRLVEEMQEGAALFTVDGLVLYGNRVLGAMLGTPLERFIGAQVQPFVDSEDQEKLTALLKQGRNGTARGEVVLRVEDGTRVPVHITVHGMQVAEEWVLCAVITDLRAQKRMEQIVSEERLARAILEQAGEAVVVCDVEGTVLRASRVAHQLCGRNPLQQPFDEVFSLQVLSRELFGPEEIEPEPFSMAAVLEGAPIRRREAVLIGKEDRRFIVLFSAVPLRGEDGQALGCVLIQAGGSGDRPGTEHVPPHCLRSRGASPARLAGFGNARGAGTAGLYRPTCRRREYIKSLP